MSSPSQPTNSASPPEVSIGKGSERGYARDPQLRQELAQATAQLREVDGYVGPADPKRGPELRADLALEGGEVMGIGPAGAVLVLEEAECTFPRVAGTSAGVIAASLIAAISEAGKPMSSLRGYLNTLDFINFMPQGKIHHFLYHLGRPGQMAGAARVLTCQVGLYLGHPIRPDTRPARSAVPKRGHGRNPVHHRDGSGRRGARHRLAGVAIGEGPSDQCRRNGGGAASGPG